MVPFFLAVIINSCMEWTREEKLYNANKKFWVRGEVKEFDDVLDFVESKIPGLTSDLLDQYEGDRHTQINQALKRTDVRPVIEDDRYAEEVQQQIIKKNPKGLSAWMAIFLRYGFDIPGNENVYNYGDRFGEGDLAPNMDIFPTAKEILTELGTDVCSIATYSILTSESIIYRHTGMENRKGTFMRVHIPLYVPPGDLFLEAVGDEITWDESFGFNNQFVHSAYNNTPEHRLCFIFDIKREFIGIPNAMNYTSSGFKKIGGELGEPFVRTSKPRPYTGKYQSI